MKSSKIVFKKGITRFCVKCKANQSLNEREVYEINQNGVPGFLPFDVQFSGKKFQLIYDLSGLVSLREFLQFNVISERMLKKILLSILDNLDIASKLFFNRNLIQFTVDTVLVNPADWQVLFIYVPVQPFETTGTIKDIFEGIVSMSSFNPREDTEYIQRFIRILNDGVNFSEYEIKEFANGLYEGSRNPSVTYIENSEEVMAKTLDSQPNSNVYNPVADNPPCAETVSIYSDFMLISDIDGSKTKIGKTNFIIGKLNGSDLVINNRAVSRKHAEIIYENGNYYVVDDDSTNGTFLNGKQIPPNSKEKLEPGDRLVFANEAYIFDKR